MPPRPLFVASLGNPLPTYANTLHSAGHTLLSSLLTLHQHTPPFSPRGPIPITPTLTFFYSPSYMNVIGPPLTRAWRAFLRSLPSDSDRRSARLVVLHDELESALGKVKTKVGGSARGHKGIRSCVECLGEKGFVRVGVGIGRPESRKSGDVSEHVLRRMGRAEVQAVRGAAEEVGRVLERLMEEGGE